MIHSFCFKILRREKVVVEEPPKPSKPLKRHSNTETEFSDRERDHHESKKREEKKLKIERSHHSPPKAKSKSKSESKKKSSRHESEEKIPEPVVEPLPEKREKTPESVLSPPKPVVKETPGWFPRFIFLIQVGKNFITIFFVYLAVSEVPVEPPPLAPEDVEMISEEEISENEEEDPPSVSGMQVMDEVVDLPNENLTPPALEDSLDMDQFEPILSGSSDIDSDEDIDLQVS